MSEQRAQFDQLTPFSNVYIVRYQSKAAAEMVSISSANDERKRDSTVALRGWRSEQGGVKRTDTEAVRGSRTPVWALTVEFNDLEGYRLIV